MKSRGSPVFQINKNTFRILEYYPFGKLSATFPRNLVQVPIYYNHKNTGRQSASNSPKANEKITASVTVGYKSW